MEKFEEHMMYDAKKAETHDEHLDLKKKGYGHKKPSGFKMAGFPEHAGVSPLKRCWKGYKPNPDGRPAKEQGSCVEK